jgi:hypothetical protein
MAREGHRFNGIQSENDPALNGHNKVTLRAMDSALLDQHVSGRKPCNVATAANNLN